MVYIGLLHITQCLCVLRARFHVAKRAIIQRIYIPRNTSNNASP